MFSPLLQSVTYSQQTRAGKKCVIASSHYCFECRRFFTVFVSVSENTCRDFHVYLRVPRRKIARNFFPKLNYRLLLSAETTLITQVLCVKLTFRGHISANLLQQRNIHQFLTSVVSQFFRFLEFFN